MEKVLKTAASLRRSSSHVFPPQKKPKEPAGRLLDSFPFLPNLATSNTTTTFNTTMPIDRLWLQAALRESAERHRHLIQNRECTVIPANKKARTLFVTSWPRRGAHPTKPPQHTSSREETVVKPVGMRRDGGADSSATHSGVSVRSRCDRQEGEVAWSHAPLCRSTPVWSLCM